MRKILQNEDDKREFNRIYQKNPDLKHFVQLFLENRLDKLKCFKWLPLSTAAVEKSFSVYNAILTDRRTNLKPQTIFKIFILIND